ncbi:YcxB-like protein [Chitinophaga skermanii]|uniref:YcxB-like protein n=1 Tax=Chitinophaga skermanii TaxID=331697 RepID=A0A327QHC7_9BACT|nr:YcxB family protein [Chitinophaga skermanii]RAJ04016.1 YcxB-like protein [Chitinophaga skermanii]
MPIEFTYNKQDVINALRFHFWHRGEIRVLRITFLVLAILTIAGYMTEYVNLNALVMIMTMVVVLYGGIYFLLPISTYNKAATFKDSIHLRWNENGILITTNKSERVQEWKRFKHVIETKTFFYLYRDAKSFFLIPTNAFESEADRQAFSLYLQQIYTNYRITY